MEWEQIISSVSKPVHIVRSGVKKKAKISGLPRWRDKVLVEKSRKLQVMHF